MLYIYNILMWNKRIFLIFCSELCVFLNFRLDLQLRIRIRFSYNNIHIFHILHRIELKIREWWRPYTNFAIIHLLCEYFQHSWYLRKKCNTRTRTVILADNFIPIFYIFYLEENIRTSSTQSTKEALLQRRCYNICEKSQSYIKASKGTFRSIFISFVEFNLTRFVFISKKALITVLRKHYSWLSKFQMNGRNDLAEGFLLIDRIQNWDFFSLSGEIYIQLSNTVLTENSLFAREIPAK